MYTAFNARSNNIHVGGVIQVDNRSKTSKDTDLGPISWLCLLKADKKRVVDAKNPTLNVSIFYR